MVKPLDCKEKPGRTRHDVKQDVVGAICVNAYAISRQDGMISDSSFTQNDLSLSPLFSAVIDKHMGTLHQRLGVTLWRKWVKFRARVKPDSRARCNPVSVD